MEKAQMVEAMKEAMTADSTHADHHRFIQLCIEREERRRSRWEKIRTQVAGWGIISLLAAIGTAVYQTFFKGGGAS